MMTEDRSTMSASADRSIVVLGVPTALGGHLAGMELAPAGLRSLGLLERLAAQPGLANLAIHDAGDLPIEPGFRADDDQRARNIDLICEFLPRESEAVDEALGGAAPVARLLVLGGDCTAHAGAMAGLRVAMPGEPLAIAWFDAHGDFNTPDSTPSGNVWGMPFAMICGRGEADLVEACDGPTVLEEHAALIGGQVLDEAESRALAASQVAHFGAGMIGLPSGLAALGAWAREVGRSVGGIYIAVDMDCLDANGGWAVTMPEPDGLSLRTTVAAVSALAEELSVIGLGATGVTLANGDAEATADAIAALAAAAFSGR
jgi:arginase